MALDLFLYLVTDPVLNGGRPLVDVVGAAVKGASRWCNCATRWQNARADRAGAGFGALWKPLGVPLIINDRVDVALAAGADGVHLGQSDMDARQARALLGGDAIIGLSVGSEAEWQASQGALTAVDYIGTCRSLARRPRAMPGRSLAMMAFRHARPHRHADGGNWRGEAGARGGVSARRADGVAVVSAIMMAEDPQAAAGFRAGAG